jgi:hypothetical protein
MAQKAEADAAFQRGRTLMAKGDTVAACAEFETSMRLEPLHGTLYNLALCHEQLGKIASAWTELKELAENDTNAVRAKDAARRAAALEKKLTRMRIEVTSPAPDLVIKRDDIDVTALANRDVPVDPGRYTFVATAPGKKPVTFELDIRRPGRTVAVPIPELVADSQDASPQDAPFTISPFAPSRTLRPLALPSHLAEASAKLAWASASSYEQDAVDTILGGRMGFGPIEAQLSVSIHTRYNQVMATRPTLIRHVAVGASYVIGPLFAASVSYRKNHVLGDNIDQGSELRGGITRKLVFTPKIAVTGFGGVSFETYATRGVSETNEFALAGVGMVQLAPLRRLTLEASADLLLNLGGALRSETLGLGVGATASFAVDMKTDIYTQVVFTAAPSASGYRAYMFGALRRLP